MILFIAEEVLNIPENDNNDRKITAKRSLLFRLMRRHPKIYILLFYLNTYHIFMYDFIYSSFSEKEEILMFFFAKLWSNSTSF